MDMEWVEAGICRVRRVSSRAMGRRRRSYTKRSQGRYKRFGAGDAVTVARLAKTEAIQYM